MRGPVVDVALAAPVCESRTVAPTSDWSDIGARLREARIASALTQEQLAGRTGLERSALAKVEAGDRRLDALEFSRISAALGLPLAHLVSPPPRAMVSRRAALVEEPDAAARARFMIDVALMQHARDVTQLIGTGHLVPVPRPDVGTAADPESARAAARACRTHLDLGQQPLGDLASVGERVGLYLLVVDLDVDGASLRDEHHGVAVLGGLAAPGRRRATAAHELGHHVLGDEYSSDVGVSASRDQREEVIDAFASEFLLPSAVVERRGHGRAGDDLRAALVGVAGTWRTSWSLVVATAGRALDVPEQEQRRLRSSEPGRAEFIEVLGREPDEDLPVGATGVQWRSAVLAALRAGDIAPARAVELLHGLLDLYELVDRSAGLDW